MQSKVTYRLEGKVIIFQVQLFLQSAVLLIAKLEEQHLGQWLSIQYFHKMLQTKAASPIFCLEEWHIEVQLPFGPSLKALYLPILKNQPSHISQLFASIIETLERQIKQTTKQTLQLELSLTNQIQQANNSYSQLCDSWRNSQRRKREAKDQLDQLNEEVMKLNRQIVVLDEDILRGKRGLELERYRADTKAEKIEERKRKVYLSELAKSNHPKVQKVVKDCVGLQKVDLCQCDLKFMKFVQMFPQVQELYLSSNAIKRMEGLGGLTMLRKLDLGHNIIEKIDGLSNNLELRELDLQSNKIVKLENLFHLSRLEILSLSNNQLEEIPREIKALDALIAFKVINNALAFLPWQLTNLRKLRTFSLLGNPCFRESNRSKQVISRLVQQQVSTCCGTP